MTKALPISAFAYCPERKAFIYLSTGEKWNRHSVDAVVEKVEHEGRLLRPTEYLRLVAEKRT